MHQQRHWWWLLLPFVLLLAVLFAPSSAGGMQRGEPRPSALSMPLPESAAGSFRGPSSNLRRDAAVEQGAALAAAACVLGDINCDGIVDIRDYGVWRQNFGQTNCGNPADLNGDCLVDILDYGIWRQHFGQTGPTPGRAYVANFSSNSVTVIDTTTSTVVGAPIPVGTFPLAVGIGP